MTIILIITRILAQIIDISIYFAIVVISYITMLPFFITLTNSNIIASIVVFIISFLIYSLFQYPFLKVNQTIGKGFFSLEIASTNKHRPLNTYIIIQRELFIKVMTLFIFCFPVLLSKPGLHEELTETEVVVKKINKR